jgi:hypothetical protein
MDKKSEKAYLDQDPIDISFKNASNHLITGATGTGKTVIVYKLLKYKNILFKNPPYKVIYYYSLWQPIFTKLQNENLVDDFFIDIPKKDSLCEILKTYNAGHTLIIFDDLLEQVNDLMSEAFRVYASKFNTSFIFISQNLFHKNPNYRTMSLNAHYIYICKAIRDKSQINHFAKQYSPNRNKPLLDAYDAATKDKPYSFFLVDCHQTTPEYVRNRSNIFPCENEIPVRTFILSEE